MPGNLCEHCTAVCCRYIALPIDTPEDPGDFDDIRWYLMHENISVFVEDGDWYICIPTTCRHLQPDHRCGIYATRPRICRQYSTADCDYHSGDYDWEQRFACTEHLDEYVRARRGGNGCARARVREIQRFRMLEKNTESGRRRDGKNIRKRRNGKIDRRAGRRPKLLPARQRGNGAGARTPLDRRGNPLPVPGTVP